MLAVKFGAMMVVAEVVDNLRRCDSTGGKGCEYPCSQTCTRFGACLHIHFAENIGEEFHTVVVIDSHELVILLLRNLVADDLAVYHCGHAVFSLRLAGMHEDFIHLNLAPVRTLLVPSFAAVLIGEVLAVNDLQHFAVGGESALLCLLRLQRLQDFPLLLYTLVQILPDFGMQRNIDTLHAVEHLPRDGIGKIILDDIVQHFQPALDRCGLDVIRGEYSDCTVSVLASASMMMPCDERHSCHFSLEK